MAAWMQDRKRTGSDMEWRPNAGRSEEESLYSLCVRYIIKLYKCCLSTSALVFLFLFLTSFVLVAHSLLPSIGL